ncbi:hypothetical protein [Dorea formicigenerans]|uniref:hypothetical protein n=1 Tax=Dorea formicigenerans TaxID=39486 RepID=UPI0015FBBEF6|nr:hypothetical protein [Dorea formicigenerans]
MADLEKEKLSEEDMNKMENSNSVEKLITPEEEYEKVLKRRKKLSSWGLVFLTVAEIIVAGGLGQKIQANDLQQRVLREVLKSDVEYTRDKTVQYIKAKNMILEYLQTNDQITSAKIQEMCGFTKQQARSVIDKMRSEKLINLNGKGPAARYVIFDGLSDN